MALQVMSNVKIITTGVPPTKENLLVGQAAFGKITSDGKYHIYGNSDGEVIDLVISSVSDIASVDLEGVLTNGNTTTLSITFDDESGNVTVISNDGLTVTDGTRQLAMKATSGFTDAGQPVLSANPNNTINSTQAETMRGFLDVYSKTEINTKITGIYKYKGTVASFSALIAKEEYTPEVGDTWNIETAGGTDKNGTAIKAGDNIAFVGPEKATDWDVLAGVIDLTNYYTKSEVDNIKETLETSIQSASSAASAADKKATTAQSEVDALETRVQTVETAGYQTASDVQTILTNGHYVSDENYVHTDTNYTAADATKVSKILTNGDGTKILTDDGTYQTLEISVVSI